MVGKHTEWVTIPNFYPYFQPQFNKKNDVWGGQRKIKWKGDSENKIKMWGLKRRCWPTPTSIYGHNTISSLHYNLHTLFCVGAVPHIIFNFYKFF